jgi:hypothetical protein
MDEFTGRVYAFLPCHFSKKIDLDIFYKKLAGVASKKEIDFFYENEVKQRIAGEISVRSRKEFERGYLGEFSFNFYGKNESDLACIQKLGRVYFTLNKVTQLCVLNIVFHVESEPVTQFLDRLSREGISMNHNDNYNFDFYSYLKTEWGLGVVGKARVCLSSGREIAEVLKPSLFASEMHNSDVMDYASLLSGFGQGNWKDNIAIYNSSHIHASKTTVLRFDPELDVIVGTQKSDLEENFESVECLQRKALHRDLMLTFIIEILMFREASIKRANLRVNTSIKQDEQLSLADINNLMGDFKAAILFWDLDIFLYPTAQQLADTLNEKFDIDRSLETYHKNQSFLEQRVNLSSAIEAEKETRTINYIAIIVFFFEAINMLFIVAQSVVRKEDIPMDLIYSSGLAFAGSIVLFSSILLVVKMRRLKTKIGWKP